MLSAKKKPSLWRGLTVTAAVFLMIVVIALSVLNGVDRRSDAAQTQLVKDAVRAALMTCYAVEGAYPAELSYLTEHYGLVYDSERYVVFYDAFASNILPEVRVTERGADGL
ncbi:MAG: hypothetical protein MJ099_03205 [Clostridia bacterium]|nr:hypothetical protein [Clostridia bacterium]